MAWVTRKLLPTYRVTVPAYLNQVVDPVYLGMPPLPIGTGKPLAARGIDATGVNKNATTATVRGISNGRVTISAQQTGTALRRPGRKRNTTRTAKQATSPKTSNRTRTKKTRVARSQPKRAANGKFLPSKKKS